MVDAEATMKCRRREMNIIGSDPGNRDIVG
jgi:hypothetical protein